jgi:hypothetical protein
MKIGGIYSFNKGEMVVKKKYPKLLQEIELAIDSIDANQHKTKVSKEKTMAGKILFSPSSLNKDFKAQLHPQGWMNYKIECDYPTEYYLPTYNVPPPTKGAFRDMDFVKEKLGVEVQFGKYSFMVYNVCAKMTIFKNRGVINAGIEIVPLKIFAEEMSTGVSYYEQFVWDLKERGISNIDIPVMIIGIYE